jgi:Zn-dependent protease
MSQLILALPILLFSVIVHEIAHGWVALRCGDPTARDAGRLTLNPLPHIEIFSTVILPALCLISGMGFFIASARPVPVNPYLLRGGERDHLKVTLAGPFSNFLLALAAALVAVLAALFNRAAGSEMASAAIILLNNVIGINLILCNFNLLPLPPLDGSWVLFHFLPAGWKGGFIRLQRHGFLILIVLLALSSSVGGGFDIFDVIFYPSRKLMIAFGILQRRLLS